MVAGFCSTAFGFISVPVAARVSIAITGTAASGVIMRFIISHPLKFPGIQTEIILAESITLPPPSATIASILLSEAYFTAASTSSINGFGLIPLNSNILQLAELSCFTIIS